MTQEMVDQDIIDRVSEPILREYRLAFQGLRDTIAAIPDNEWIRGETRGPARLYQASLVHPSTRTTAAAL
jgi:hypothetical protein